MQILQGAYICPYSRPAGRNDTLLIKPGFLSIVAQVENCYPWIMVYFL